MTIHIFWYDQYITTHQGIAILHQYDLKAVFVVNSNKFSKNLNVQRIENFLLVYKYNSDFGKTMKLDINKSVNFP